LLGNGKVLIAAGYLDGGCLTTTELYDPASGTFAAGTAMSEGRESCTTTLLTNGAVFLAGGNGCDSPMNYFADAELYNSTTGTFGNAGSMKSARTSHTATRLANGQVLLAGGWVAALTSVASAELYDPVGGTFAPTGSMSVARDQHTATLLEDGTVLIAGGWKDTTTGATSSAEIYKPSGGTFSTVSPMNSGRYGHTATALPNRKVLLAGGAPAPSSELYVY
jgi:hypothetical protein